MKVKELADQVGKSVGEIAQIAGIDGRGAVHKDLSDEQIAKVQASLKDELDSAAFVESGEKERVRYWTPTQNYHAVDPDKFGENIEIEGWSVVVEPGTPFAEKIEKIHKRWPAFIKIIKDEPYKEDEQRREFEVFLRSLIFTGPPPGYEASITGTKAVLAMFSGDEIVEMNLSFDKQVRASQVLAAALSSKSLE